MEIFKYINKKMELVTTNLVEQNDFIGFELGEEDSQDYSELENLDELDLFNESPNETLSHKKSEAEKINDSFANYFGLSDQHDLQKKKAAEKMKQYQSSKSRRLSKQSNHEGIDEFLGIGRNSGKFYIFIFIYPL